MIAQCKITVTLLGLLALVLSAAPALAASPGGASPDLLTLPGATPIVVRIGNPVVTANANGISIAARATSMLRGRMRIVGTAAPQTPGGVRIERFDAAKGWIAVTTVTVTGAGTFSAVWHPSRTGPLQLRAVAAGGTTAGASGDAAAAAAPAIDLTVYRPGVASWYGPVRRGRTTTACGVTLDRTTVGVAHRTLPCGTPVALYYKGRTIVVPVIDRGPFVDGRTWDLTHATFTALGGDDGLVTVGALPLPPQPAASAGS
jgi:rare lipoprotein A